MLIWHTSFAFVDPVSSQQMTKMMATMHPELSKSALARELARVALAMQHLPSSSFVLAKAAEAGVKIYVEDLARAAGYSPEQAEQFQHFYNVSGTFKSEWLPSFSTPEGPTGSEFGQWKAKYRQAYKQLPSHLKFQLWTDTLTNFGTGSMAKWLPIAKSQVPQGIPVTVDSILQTLATIVLQYQNEWVHLHGRSAKSFIEANQERLREYGIIFEAGAVRYDPEELTEANRQRAQALIEGS
jgi:hypothetical protein